MRKKWYKKVVDNDFDTEFVANENSSAEPRQGRQRSQQFVDPMNMYAN
jgi:hypothetical protein